MPKSPAGHIDRTSQGSFRKCATWTVTTVLAATIAALVQRYVAEQGKVTVGEAEHDRQPQPQIIVLQQPQGGGATRAVTVPANRHTFREPQGPPAHLESLLGGRGLTPSGSGVAGSKSSSNFQSSAEQSTRAAPVSAHKAKGRPEFSTASPQEEAASLYSEAMKDMQSKHYESAEQKLRQTLARDGSNHRAHYALALILAEKEDLDGCISHLKRAVELSPGTVTYRLKLGWAYHDKGNIDAAVGQWNKVLELSPGNQAATEALELVKSE